MVTLLKLKLFQLKEQLHVISCYYRKSRFAFIDLAFCVSAFFSNPYRVCRKFTGAHAYGETPIRTFAKLASWAELGPRDTFVDLGSGRGKLCFWSALWIGCSSIGIEQVPAFVRQAKALARLFRVRATFELGGMETIDLSQATVVYLYVMEWDESLLYKMQAGARLISVGAPIEGFETMHIVQALYPWGETSVYIQKRGEAATR